MIVATLAAALAGCVAAGPNGSSSPGASPSPTGFSLLAWTTQAVAPESAFATPARLAIADGRLIDTAVAVPAIYPGPLLVEPFARPISAHGIATIEDALRAGGLTISRDFTGGTLPGGVVAHLAVVLDGQRVELSGDPTRLVRSDCASGARCVPEPGTPEAFAAFWQQLTGDPDSWLGADLGAQARYDAERLAILAVPPVPAAAPIEPGTVAWPLAPFSSFGTAYAGGRCGTVSGAGAGTLLPVLRIANSITRFRDSTGDTRSLVTRVLLPGETDACGTSGASSPSPSGSGGSPAPSGTQMSLAPSGGASSGSGGGSTGSGSDTPTVLGLVCFGSGSVFPASALTGPATAEQGSDPAAAALRTLLGTAGADTAWLPRKGWSQVAGDASHVLFVAPSPAGDGYVSVSVVPVAGSSAWKADGYGTCRILTKLAPPFGVATWTLSAPAVPDTEVFTALVSEMSCASGEPAGPRVSAPLIVYGERTVTVTFGVTQLGGAQTCPAPPPSPVEVRLREPLGSRQLVDGAVYPPSPVEVSNPH
ncbi:MAG TPA: hypothetical protein VEY67_01315 [Candidatus Dormibacteraeota bacterium]|nr:hypothetical protein [Candidatus Dormibacteraeota bacterium]